MLNAFDIENTLETTQYMKRFEPYTNVNMLCLRYMSWTPLKRVVPTKDRRKAYHYLHRVGNSWKAFYGYNHTATKRETNVVPNRVVSVSCMEKSMRASMIFSALVCFCVVRVFLSNGVRRQADGVTLKMCCSVRYKFVSKDVWDVLYG